MRITSDVVRDDMIKLPSNMMRLYIVKKPINNGKTNPDDGYECVNLDEYIWILQVPCYM